MKRRRIREALADIGLTALMLAALLPLLIMCELCGIELDE